MKNKINSFAEHVAVLEQTSFLHERWKEGRKESSGVVQDGDIDQLGK